MLHAMLKAVAKGGAWMAYDAYKGKETPDDPNSAENRARVLGGSLLNKGGQQLDESYSAFAGINPDEYLGSDALKAMFEQSATTSFLPALRGLQGRNSARGGRGPIAGALEGDLTSSFQRNLLATTAQFGAQRGNLALGRARGMTGIGDLNRSQGVSLLGTELELQMAREQADREQAASKRRGIGSLIGGIGGGIIGSIVPGIGTGVGAGIGSKIGGSF